MLFTARIIVNNLFCNVTVTKNVLRSSLEAYDMECGKTSGKLWIHVADFLHTNHTFQLLIHIVL